MAAISRLPMPIQETYEWQYDGACREADPETFFSPDAERGPRRRAREAAAKALCAVCPVVQECLQHALTVREPYGVWGGLTINERDSILQQRATG
ncbi:MAG: WhiB family transcriptional regulator [Aeromicrobium sp.]